jgi:hypothetical protein
VHATSRQQSRDSTEPVEDSANVRDLLLSILALLGAALVTLAWLFALIQLARLVISGLF